MYFSRRLIALLLAFAPLVALAAMPVAQDEFPPDLAVLSADEWDFEEDGRVLVLYVEVANLGAAGSPESVVRVFAWEEFDAGVPPLGYEERTVVEVWLPIPLELAGTTQEFYLEVDPDGRVPDYEPDNNGYTTPPITLPGQQEKPTSELYVEGVSPGEAAPGEEFAMEVFGGGFEQGVEVFVEGLETGPAERIDDTYLVVQVFVPEGATTSLRDVEVINPDGTTAILNNAFQVVGGGGPPPVPSPGPSPGPGPDLLVLILIGGVVLVVGVGAVVLVVRVVTRPGKKALQKQAQKQEPPDECVPGSRWVREIELEVEPGRWEIGDLEVLLYDAKDGTRGQRHEASRKVVGGLNKAIGVRRRRPNDRERFDEALLPAAEELAAQVIGWQALETAARDVLLNAKLEGGEAEVKFVAYRCKGQPGNTRWVKEREWPAKVKATAEQQVGTLWGPRPGEEQAAHVERTQREVAERLRQLAAEVAKM